MMDRIADSLQRAGMPEFPRRSGLVLADYGFDSLVMVLTVGELEKDFGIRIPADSIKDGDFESMETIGRMLARLGVDHESGAMK